MIISEAQEYLILELYRLGWSVTKIAERYNMSFNRVRRIVARVYDLNGGNRKTTEHTKQRIVDDYEKNGIKSVKRLAKKYALAEVTVYNILRKAKVNMEYVHDNTKRYLIMADLKAGKMSQSDIAAKHNVSRQWVSRIKHDLQKR